MINRRVFSNPKLICTSVIGLIIVVGVTLFQHLNRNDTEVLCQRIADGDYKAAIRIINNGGDANAQFINNDSVLVWIGGRLAASLGRHPVSRHFFHGSLLQAILSSETDERTIRYPKYALSLTQCLLSHGARPNVSDELGRTPFWYAIKLNRRDIAEVLLLKGADPNIPGATSDIGPPILWASLKSVTFLVQHGVAVNATNRSGETALFRADSGTCSTLIDHGALIEARDAQGRTPLLRHAACGPLATIEVLTSRGANIRATDNVGGGVLHYAILRNDTDVLKYLIANHASLDMRDNSGRTPMMSASSMGTLESIRILVRSGAKLDIRDVDGKTAVDIAVDAGFADVVNELRNMGAHKGSEVQAHTKPLL